MKRKPNRTRTIQGAKDKQLKQIPIGDVYYSGGTSHMGEVEMNQHQRCGGGRRVLKKSLGGGY